MDSKKILIGKTILIVDDEAEIREIIVDEMKSYGVKTLEASNGNEAYKIVMSHNINAVISDIRMPEGDGIEFLKHIKDSKPKIPFVILMTGFAEVTKDEAISLGAVALIKKPPEWKELIQEVINALIKSEEADLK